MRGKFRLPVSLLIVAVLLLPLSLVRRVPPGHYGIRGPLRNGADPTILAPGFHFRVPLLQRFDLVASGPQTVPVTARARLTGGVQLELSCELTGRPDPGALVKAEAHRPEIAAAAALGRDLESWARFLPPAALLLHGPGRDTLELLAGRAERLGLLDPTVSCGPARTIGGAAAGLPEVRRESGSVHTGVRVLLIGLDGADWKVMRPLLEQHALPNFARLLQDGAAAELRSFEPMLSPLLWTTVATGVSPDRHGVLDFLVTDPATGAPMPIPATYRRAKAIWNLATEFGRTTSFVGWWATWPAESIAGTMVSDRVAYSLFEVSNPDRDETAAISPPAAARRLAARQIAAGSIRFEEVSRFADISRSRYRQAVEALGGPIGSSYHDPVTHLLKIIASTRTYHGMAMDLLEADQPDIFGVYFQGIDEISHRFAHFMPPKMQMAGEDDFRRYRETVKNFYVWQDALIGELLDLAAPDTMVVVLSDHGFLSGSDRPEGLPPNIEGKPDRWHREQGILLMSGGPVIGGSGSGGPAGALRFAESLQGASLYDIAPTVLYVAGLPVSREMPGLPLLAALDPGFIAATPLFLVDSYGPPPEPGGLSAPRSSMDDEVVARLRSLGYLGADSGPRPAGSGQPSMAATFHANRAFLRLSEGDPEGARTEVELALESRPDYLPALVLRARILEEGGEIRAALEAARATLDEGLRQGDRQPGNVLQLARLYLELGETAAGLEVLNGILDRVGEDPELLVGVGLLRAARGDERGAEASFRAAVGIDPAGEEPVRRLFFLLLQEGRLEEAEELVRTARSLAPASVVHANLLGLLHLEREQLGEAEAAFVAARALDPGDVSTLANLGALYGRSGRLEEAVELLRLAVTMEPDHHEALVNLAAALGRLNRLEEVIFRLEAARARGVESPEILNGLGLAYMQSGRRAEAIDAFRASLVLSPDQGPVQQMLQSLASENGSGDDPGRSK